MLRADDARLVAFAEGQLQLALNRSGAEPPDALLQALDHQLRKLGDPTAGAAERQAVMATLERLDVVAPRWANAAFRRGELLAVAGDHAGCVVQQRRALARDEHHLPAMLQLGICQKELKETGAALSTFTQLRQRHPTMAGLRRLKQWMASAAEQQDKRATRRAPS